MYRCPYITALSCRFFQNLGICNWFSYNSLVIYDWWLAWLTVIELKTRFSEVKVYTNCSKYNPSIHSEMQYPSSSPLPSGTPLGNGPKVQYNQGISNCSNYCTLQDDCITHQLPTMPFTNVSSHGNNNVQFSPLHRPQQPHNNVQYPPVNVLPEPSVKPLNHSDDNPLPKGKNCAVYDPTAPTGCRIKYYQRSHRKKKDNINDIATKLNVSLIRYSKLFIFHVSINLKSRYMKNLFTDTYCSCNSKNCMVYQKKKIYFYSVLLI